VFVLITSRAVAPSYTRFVVRRLREEFGFVGTPIHISIKARENRNGR
jgi:GTPase